MTKETARSSLFAVVLVTAEKEILIKIGNKKHIKAITGEQFTTRIKGVEVNFSKNPQAIHVYELSMFSRSVGLLEAVESMEEIAKAELNDFASIGIDWQALPR